MASNENDLEQMYSLGMIDQHTYESMLKDLYKETNNLNIDKKPILQTDIPLSLLPAPHSLKIKSGAYTVKGPRQHNEDSFYLPDTAGGAKDTDSAVLEIQGDGPFFFAAADGMGGHDAGDIASAFVVQKLKEKTQNIKHPVTGELIEDLLQNIHKELLEEGIKRQTPKMGSTIAGIVLQKGESGFFNAGDSRVYRLRHGYLEQISRDDSLAAIIPGAKKNIITNAVGAGQERMGVAARFAASFAVEGDVFLMCSDGVHGAVDDDDLSLILGLKDSPKDIARIIIAERAVKNNTDDNCTAVVVKLEKN